MAPDSKDFQRRLEMILEDARGRSIPFVDIVSDELHRIVGGYPNVGNHRMPICCSVMKKMMQGNDEILGGPLKGVGATLRIRYYLSPS